MLYKIFVRRIFTFIFLFSLIASISDAQSFRRRHSSFGRRAPYQYELVASLGASNFLGDLGGANNIGTHGFKDLELSMTRPAIGIGVRKYIMQYLTAKGSFYWGKVQGNDKLTEEPFRHVRNLNFKSNLFELTTQLEFNFMKAKKGHIYRIKGIRGMKSKEKDVFIFIGGGLVHFNPKGLYDGKWYELQPIGTEGQGHIPGMKKYRRTTGIVMFGAGMRYAISRYWGIGLELGLRQTFSDYIDDVSTSYPSQSVFNGDPVASALSNAMDHKSPYACATCNGAQRGDPSHKDSYMFGSITIGYKVIHRRHSRSKF